MICEIDWMTTNTAFVNKHGICCCVLTKQQLTNYKKLEQHFKPNLCYFLKTGAISCHDNNSNSTENKKLPLF